MKNNKPGKSSSVYLYVNKCTRKYRVDIAKSYTKSGIRKSESFDSEKDAARFVLENINQNKLNKLKDKYVLENGTNYFLKEKKQLNFPPTGLAYITQVGSRKFVVQILEKWSKLNKRLKGYCIYTVKFAG